jgi:hypothetical protein
MSDKPEQFTTLAVDPRWGSLGVGAEFGKMKKYDLTEADRRKFRGALPLAWRLVLQGPLDGAPPEKAWLWLTDAPDIQEMKGYAPNERAARRCAMDALKAAEVKRKADAKEQQDEENADAWACDGNSDGEE